jgi:hypothetical protein
VVQQHRPLANPSEFLRKCQYSTKYDVSMIKISLIPFQLQYFFFSPSLGERKIYHQQITPFHMASVIICTDCDSDVRLKIRDLIHKALCSGQRELCTGRRSTRIHRRFSGEPTQIMRRIFVEYLGTDCFHFCRIPVALNTKRTKPSSNAQCTDNFIYTCGGLSVSRKPGRSTTPIQH